MLSHSLIISIILYLIMMLLRVDAGKAENLSILIASLALQYMILFGHNMPHMSNISHMTNMPKTL